MGEYINSQNLRFDRSHISCGVIEVHHIPENTQRSVFAIATTLYHKANPRPAAFLIFSDVVGETYIGRGERLAAAMEKLGVVGNITASDKAVNPRTGNTIRVWLVTLDHDSFRKWYQEELANRLTEE